MKQDIMKLAHACWNLAKANEHDEEFNRTAGRLLETAGNILEDAATVDLYQHSVEDIVRQALEDTK